MKTMTKLAALAALTIMTSCNTKNPLLEESTLPYGAPRFDKIKTEHYMPAFQQGIAEAKADIDAITSNPEAPTFANTIEALEFSGRTLEKVSAIFYNVLEANSDDEMQALAEELSPMLNEYSMYVSLNEKLFERIKAVYEGNEVLDDDQKRLLTKTYRRFQRSGANLVGEQKERYSALEEQLSLCTLKYGRNVLGATNAFCLNLTDEADLAGLPDYLVELGAQTAAEKGQTGWTFDLSYPSYAPFCRYSTRSDLRKQMYMAYTTRAVGGEFDNAQLVPQIANLRLEKANLLGYETFADYVLEQRMIKTPAEVDAFLASLLNPSMPAAKREIKAIYDYAVAHGYTEKQMNPWDFSFWTEKYKQELYTLSESELKPYFQIENCIDAVFALAGKLYGLTFEERKDIPGYHPDVKVYDVKDENGRHMALFYADFFPRASKRGGAWMTEFRGQSIENGVENRPFISLVTNFSKPTGNTPSLLTHGELETFLHEFGHSLHGILAEGRYPSLCTTNVSTDFVELPSQIMENWAYEKEFLQGFAKHYQTGEVIPAELIDRIIESRNFNSAYLQVRQLNFGILDMAWHERKTPATEETLSYEKKALQVCSVLPYVEGTSISTSITHLFSGGYAAGYYSYKWSEVLEADAFEVFQEMGIFSREAGERFRSTILSRGGSKDEEDMYVDFKGRKPEVGALLRKLGII